jgi:hypothetical protein
MGELIPIPMAGHIAAVDPLPQRTHRRSGLTSAADSPPQRTHRHSDLTAAAVSLPQRTHRRSGLTAADPSSTASWAMTLPKNMCDCIQNCALRLNSGNWHYHGGLALPELGESGPTGPVRIACLAGPYGLPWKDLLSSQLMTFTAAVMDITNRHAWPQSPMAGRGRLSMLTAPCTATKIPFMYFFSGNIHIHVSVSDFYIPRIAVHIFPAAE